MDELDARILRLFVDEGAPLAGLLHWLESWLAHDMAFRLLTHMRVDLFDFDLPDELIAQRPVTPRDAARLLDVASDGLHDRTVRDLPVLLRRGEQRAAAQPQDHHRRQLSGEGEPLHQMKQLWIGQ
jgi:hypothetical protein